MSASKRATLPQVTNLTRIELELSMAKFEDQLAEEALSEGSDESVAGQRKLARSKMDFMKHLFLSEF